MRVVELSTERSKLPSIKEWIEPVYEGLVSEFDSEVLGIQVNAPNNWQTDFPTYDYKFSTLTKLVKNYKKEKRPESTTDVLSQYEQIIENGGLHLSPTWVDVYTQYKRLDIGIVPTIQKKKPTTNPRKPTLTKFMRITDSKPYRSFHDGSISAVTAMQYHMHENHPSVTWQWMAVTEDKFTENNPSEFLNDNKRNFTKGIDGDGDFSQVNNIRGLEWEFGRHFEAETIHLYTGDSTKAGWKLPSQIYTACRFMAKGGTAMFKVDIPDTGYMISLIYLLSGAFNIVEFVQGSGAWIVCSNFMGLSKVQRIRLENTLAFMRTAAWPGPALFPRRQIPTSLNLALITAFSNLKKVNLDSILE